MEASVYCFLLYINVRDSSISTRIPLHCSIHYKIQLQIFNASLHDKLQLKFERQNSKFENSKIRKFAGSEGRIRQLGQLDEERGEPHACLGCGDKAIVIGERGERGGEGREEREAFVPVGRGAVVVEALRGLV